ncbi:leucine-rich repeat domain-containing protein [Xanthomonas hydrangeae]|uniref:Leucine-rich repeat domain-containing protein n=1 Tax=Xanthomonas hydrangeae TaxID=2775159 RepID=A0AAU0BDA6_9XANT|nr:type III secretion system leucine-rich repeat domain-containing effector XopL [Xanthomonas hydrangeae]WOB50180.1 leucine-rich repeat domain-containing protein [Xanthomonas hydrangeae]
MPRINGSRPPEAPGDTRQDPDLNPRGAHNQQAGLPRNPQRSAGLLSGLERLVPRQNRRRNATSSGSEATSSQQGVSDARHDPGGSGGHWALDQASVDAFQPHALPQLAPDERVRFHAAATASPQILAPPLRTGGPTLRRSTQVQPYESVLSQWRQQCEADFSQWSHAWNSSNAAVEGIQRDPRLGLQFTATQLARAESPDNDALMVEYNPLPRLPEPMFHLAHLQRISISNAGLMELPESISQLANLRIFELHGNPIDKLPASISGLGQLEQLSIRSCPNLSELPKDLAIRNVDNRREGLVKLRQLDLSRTGIRSLPKSLRYLKDLKKIRVSSSPLTALDKDIHLLPNLQELDLHSCTHLREYPSISRGRPPMEKLILRDCSNLRTLPHDIHKLTNLRKLDLRGCSNLRSLPRTISRLPADCMILVPAHLQEQLSQLRSEASSAQTGHPTPFAQDAAGPSHRHTAGAASPATTSTNQDTRQQDSEKILNTAYALLEVIGEERNPFVEGAPPFNPEQRPAEAPTTLGQVPALRTMLAESRNQVFMTKLKDFAKRQRTAAYARAQTRDELATAPDMEWREVMSSHLGPHTEKDSDGVKKQIENFTENSQINIFNLSKAVQMWKIREMLVLDDPANANIFPEIPLYLPPEDAGSD